MRVHISQRITAIGLALALVGAVSVWRVQAAATSAPAISITVSNAVPAFTPRVIVAQANQPIAITNESDHSLLLSTTPHAPSSVQLTVQPGATNHFTLTTPGLYHFYDGAIAHVIDYAADNDVVRALQNASNQNLPSQGWVFVPGLSGVPLNQHIEVPNGNDLLDPLVAVAQVGGSVSIHNGDTDPHNLVTDPADPTGIAFELLGTDGEPAIHGATRRIIFTEPGLYHIYCTIHAMLMGQAGGWQVVMPRDVKATGFLDHNPMEAWFLAVR